jgi:hypothetical protein
VENMGFAFILSPPGYPNGPAASVDVALLALELAVCLAITVALIFVFKGRA